MDSDQRAKQPGNDSAGGPPVVTCPSCKQETCIAHVEHDRIAWWSCFDCNAQWPSGEKSCQAEI